VNAIPNASEKSSCAVVVHFAHKLSIFPSGLFHRVIHTGGPAAGAGAVSGGGAAKIGFGSRPGFA
jgi:hypothetical protein